MSIRFDIPAVIRNDLSELNLFVESVMPRTWKSVKPKDVITPAYIQDLIQHGGAKDTGTPHPKAKGLPSEIPFHYSDSMPEFHRDAGAYPKAYAHLKDLDYNDVVKHPQYPEALLKVSMDHFRMARNKFATELKTTPEGVEAYRMIRVDRDESKQILKGGSLGTYWTFNEYASEDDRNFWSGGKESYDSRVRLFMTAVIPQTSIDWIQSYVQNMDWFVGMSESELRVFPGSPIVLKSVRIGKRTIPVSSGRWSA